MKMRMMLAMGGVGVLDRINKINRIMRVRERNYEQFHSPAFAKAMAGKPTPTIFSNYLQIL